MSSEKSKTIAIIDIISYLKKIYKFSSLIAITYGVKVAKTATTEDLKKATGI